MKAIFTVIVALISVSCISQEFKPKIALDFFPGGYKTMIKGPVSLSTGQEEMETVFKFGYFRTRLGADFNYKKITAYFDQKIYMNKSKNVSFSPYQAEWYFGLKYNVWKKVMITYEHMCIHPIISGTAQDRSRLFGGYNMISISYGYN